MTAFGIQAIAMKARFECVTRKGFDWIRPIAQLDK